MACTVPSTLSADILAAQVAFLDNADTGLTLLSDLLNATCSALSKTGKELLEAVDGTSEHVHMVAVQLFDSLKLTLRMPSTTPPSMDNKSTPENSQTWTLIQNSLSRMYAAETSDATVATVVAFWSAAALHILTIPPLAKVYVSDSTQGKTQSKFLAPLQAAPPLHVTHSGAALPRLGQNSEDQAGSESEEETNTTHAKAGELIVHLMSFHQILLPTLSLMHSFWERCSINPFESASLPSLCALRHVALLLAQDRVAAAAVGRQCYDIMQLSMQAAAASHATSLSGAAAAAAATESAEASELAVVAVAAAGYPPDQYMLDALTEDVTGTSSGSIPKTYPFNVLKRARTHRSQYEDAGAGGSITKVESLCLQAISAAISLLQHPCLDALPWCEAMAKRFEASLHGEFLMLGGDEDCYSACMLACIQDLEVKFGSLPAKVSHQNARGGADLKGDSWQKHRSLCRLSDVCLCSSMLPRLMLGLAAKAGADKLAGRKLLSTLKILCGLNVQQFVGIGMQLLAPDSNSHFELRVDSILAIEVSVSNFLDSLDEDCQPSPQAQHAAIWSRSSVKLLIACLMHDPSIKVRRVAMRLVSLVALPESSEEVAALVQVLLTKSRDKDAVVVARALELLVQLPLQALISVCSLPQWLALFKACITHCNTSSTPPSFLHAFTEMSTKLLCCDDSGLDSNNGVHQTTLLKVFPGLRHPLCFLAMLGGSDNGSEMQRASFKMRIEALDDTVDTVLSQD